MRRCVGVLLRLGSEKSNLRLIGDFAKIEVKIDNELRRRFFSLYESK